MPGKNNHIILRQVFDFLLPPSEKDAYVLLQEIGNLAKEKLAPALDKLFDRFASPEELIRFEKVEIDIGQLQTPDISDDFVRATVNALEEKLISGIAYSSLEIKRESIGYNHFNQWLFFLEKGCLPWNAVITSEDAFHKAVLDDLSAYRVALDRLQQLLVKSPASLSRLITQHPEVFLVKLLAIITRFPQNKLPDFRKEIRKLISRVAASRKEGNASSEKTGKRLFYSTFWEWCIQQAVSQKQVKSKTDFFALDFLKYWINNLNLTFLKGESSLQQSFVNEIKVHSDSFPLLFNSIEEIENFTFPKTLQKDLPVSDRNETEPSIEETDLHTINSSGMTEKDPTQSPQKMSDENLQFMQQEKGEKQTETKYKTSPYTKLNNDQPFQIKDVDESEISGNPDERKGFIFPDNKREDVTLSKEKRQKEQKIASNSNVDVADKRLGQPLKEADIPEGTSWFVHYAGIVLLHPFLTSFFRKCHLLQKDDFVKDIARHKAVHLLQYLASGKTGLPEYDQVFPKFLCGISIDEPIEREIRITRKDKSESEDLLQSVISHWGKLGNSSPAALQEGFLQREGKLEKRQQGWYLTVEQKSIDILLEYLPWNLRMVKLPWMHDLLRVEWA